MNLESAQRMSELKATGDGEVEVLHWRTLYKQKKFTLLECIVDTARGVVWATDSSGSVRAFPATPAQTEDSEKAYHQVAHLEFGGKLASQSREFGISRVGDCLVGSGSTAQLSIWNIPEAMNDFASKNLGVKSDEGGKESSRTKEGFGPRFVQVEDVATGFNCGDTAWIGGSNLLVGAARSDDRDDLSMRHFDLEQEKVVGLYCGLRGVMSIERQHCNEGFHSIFVADSHASYVYDTRTFQPAITLETGHLEGRILGVPSEASMTAFAFCNQDQEEIQCWDLRMPACHANSMWTGNNDVDSLFWHESTASLLAATSSPHCPISGRRNATYIDDETLWPEQAVHDPDYFGNRKLCYFYDHPSIIQYSFDNGRPMTSFQ